MEEGLLMQNFYHGLTQKSREQLDATAEGSFMSLTLGKAESLIERIASNQGWSSCNKSEEVLESVSSTSLTPQPLLKCANHQVYHLVHVC
jgi:hypothetical protein